MQKFDKARYVCFVYAVKIPRNSLGASEPSGAVIFFRAAENYYVVTDHLAF